MNNVDAITVLAILCLPWFWVVSEMRSRQTAKLGKSEASAAWKNNASTARSLAVSFFASLMIGRFLLVPSLGNSVWLFQVFAALVGLVSCGLASYGFVASRKQVSVAHRK